MSIETAKTVVLHGGRRVSLPTEEQLWEVELTIALVDEKGTARIRSATKGVIHVPLATLEAHGLLPITKTSEPLPDPHPTAEDLILQLLECVGVFPTE